MSSTACYTFGMKISWAYLLSFLYVLATLVLFYFVTPRGLFTQKIRLFYQDPAIPDRVHTAIVEDLNGQRASLARLFENKASFAFENMLISLSRTTDPTFFFSLSQTTYYGESYYTLFPALFFPFFLVAAIVLIRKWEKVKKKYFFLLPLLAISLIVDMLFVPYTAPLKLIPLFITVQLITFFGIYELCIRK